MASPSQHLDCPPPGHLCTPTVPGWQGGGPAWDSPAGQAWLWDPLGLGFTPKVLPSPLLVGVLSSSPKRWSGSAPPGLGLPLWLQ